ncbi:uncharacterized protein C5L36_0C07560 [Pichia kudriavzevii]|uniref:3,4-dihydroxy-2-butanone 4-phosphate synthase n=2 Tax=Pichia kudriavzevii TaxID=4909 RepID=A0A2U9R639_PICKU|nr:uncharacterized protein C5L36_0C07560 [Pichia kudriavzevii]AWU76842.1 hypothetical protein C5L36_0C07560 [Pichia kudriavzevii]
MHMDLSVIFQEPIYKDQVSTLEWNDLTPTNWRSTKYIPFLGYSLHTSKLVCWPPRVMTSNNSVKFTPIPEALEAFKNGEFLVVMDDEDRENEGDLIMAAELMTTERMAFLVKHSSGFVCVPLSTERADELNLPFMIPEDKMTDRHGTAYTVTVDYADGTTTGISAHDRGLTAKMLGTKSSKADDFLRPGHICPLRAKPGLLRERPGHTEAAVQLCELTGLQPAGAICELVRDEDGLMMRLDDCWKFAQKYNIKIITIKELLEYLNQTTV